jgi:putative membrane protein
MNEWNEVGHMGGMWIWWILGIVVVGALAWGVLRSPARDGDAGVSAEELLKRRYARGEIDKEEYEKRLQDLRR